MLEKMKAYVCLTFIVASLFLQVSEAAAVHNDGLNLGTVSKTLLKNFKRIMPCGFEPLHIPPLAPAHVKHYEFKANSSDNNINGEVSNFFITGLENLEILSMEFNSTTRRFYFDLMFPQIQLFGEYKIDDSANLAGFPARLMGEGLFNNKFVDFRLVGEIILSSVNKSQSISITDYDFKFYLGNVVISNVNKYWDDALNTFINKFASEAILVWTQQVQNRVDDYIAAFFLQSANDFLENVSEKAIITKMLDLIVKFEMTNCSKE